MHRPLAIAYGVLSGAGLISLLFVYALSPAGAAAAAFLAVWLLLPYLGLAAAMANFGRERGNAIAYMLVAVVVSLLGLFYLTDVVFLRPDPQGAIAAVFAPIYQTIAIFLLMPLARWLVEKASL